MEMIYIIKHTISECADGSYGVNCLPCGKCTEGTVCDKRDGRCPAGCDPGYQRDDCQQGECTVIDFTEFLKNYF